MQSRWSSKGIRMSTAVIENPANLRELAEQSHAWPFEEARKIVARLRKTPKDAVIFETGYGASCLSRTDRRQEQDPADRVLRRHAWTAQSAGQRPQQGDGGAAPRQAADQGARSVRHP